MGDFIEIEDTSGTFADLEDDTGVDFFNIGDGGVIITEGEGWGEGPWGDDPWGGGEDTIIIDNSVTEWTNIETP